MKPEFHILQSWQQNAEVWTDTVRQDKIESRTLVTNRAIVRAVTECHPRSVLDVGCGEGWLARRLATPGVRALGIDAIASLIESARRADSRASYRVSTYHDIVNGCLRAEIPFDVVICNFSLLGEASVEKLVRYVPQLLSPNGRFIVQTLHPSVASGNYAYQDGWRTGSWQGFSKDFVNPAPWYFRTLAGWVQLLTRSGLTLTALHEPIHPRTQQPASVIFTSGVADQ